MNTAFYEIKHGVGADYFTLEQNTDFSFPLHMHRCYEIILLLEGSMKVCIERKEYRMQAGDMILIRPNHIHSLETEESSRHVLCIFAPELISAVAEPLNKYRLPSPLLTSSDPMYRELFLRMRENDDIATVKGFLYLLCGLFYARLDPTAEDSHSNDKLILRDIFLYVENNADKPCTLRCLSEELKYAPAYLSRFFSAHVGISYNVYVRNVKLNRACHLLRNTKESVLDIALKCGYTSLSSFNRSFKQMMGINPTEYRNRPKK